MSLKRTSYRMVIHNVKWKTSNTGLANEEEVMGSLINQRTTHGELVLFMGNQFYISI